MPSFFASPTSNVSPARGAPAHGPQELVEGGMGGYGVGEDRRNYPQSWGRRNSQKRIFIDFPCPPVDAPGESQSIAVNPKNTKKSSVYAGLSGIGANRSQPSL
jgi:hypothetical protein